jgi:CotH kinase protein/Lamin Tail Domain/Secretion system C-terminal sorting domain
MNSIKLLLTTFLVAGLHFANAQTTFYNLNTIQTVEVNFSQPNWDYQMDTARYGADGYLLANWVKINGIQYDSVGVKYKGNSSYDSTYIKNPLHIEIDHFLNQSHQGVTDIKLSNCYADPSMIREVLAYDILKNYMHAPSSNFAQLYINGSYIGLYSNDESINKDFCSNHFYSSQNTFFKCNPIVIPGPTTKSNLRYITGGDSSSYFNFYELKSASGWNDLVTLCDSVTNHGSTMESIVDIDRVAWMLAFNNLLVNLDSYTGVFCQNYYIYKDNTGHYNPVVWDLNMAFGGFPFLGSGNTSMGSLSIANMQQLNPTAHSTDPYWPLINAIMNNGMWKRMYIAHLRTIANEMIASNLYQSTAAQLQSLIDTAVLSDPNKFYTYTQFQNGLTSDYSVGTYTVPGISNLMSARMSYLQTNTDFNYTPPVISAVQSSNANPALNTIITITALVSNTNTNSVFLGYRSDISQKFTRVLMYDDGLHNDGAAGDNVYGADFTVSSAVMQYYLYAENNNAGLFAPERAEHEFYVINASIQQITAGDVVINEFMAINQNTVTDANGEFEDWIELHNNLSAPVSLEGSYLSDDAANPLKWAFPQSTVIPANGYLTAWADEDVLQTGLHTNFKLAASGEEILFSYANSIIDSIYFAQQTVDVSYGRCADGSGPFGTMTPSFAAVNNCPVGINETENLVRATLFPNPTNGLLHIRSLTNNINSITVYNTLTNLVAGIELSGQEQYLLDMRSYKNGIYFVQINKEQPVKVVLIQ